MDIRVLAGLFDMSGIPADTGCYDLYEKRRHGFPIHIDTCYQGRPYSVYPVFVSGPMTELIIAPFLMVMIRN